MIMDWLIVILATYIIPLIVLHLILYYFWVKDNAKGTTLGDMYDYYYELWDFSIVPLAWIPFINFIVLIVLFWRLMIRLLFNVRIR